jgi:hypothetical protein
LPRLDIQKPNLAAAVEFLKGRASRAVKYNGFAPSPLDNFTTYIFSTTTVDTSDFGG